MQPLMFNFPFYKIFPTKTWKQFEHHADNIFKIGRSFVDNVRSTIYRQDNFQFKMSKTISLIVIINIFILLFCSSRSESRSTPTKSCQRGRKVLFYRIHDEPEIPH